MDIENEILRLYDEECLGLHKTAEVLDVPWTRVKKTLLHNGTKIRNVSEGVKLSNTRKLFRRNIVINQDALKKKPLNFGETLSRVRRRLLKEGKIKPVPGFKGKHHSLEDRKKMSQANHRHKKHVKLVMKELQEDKSIRVVPTDSRSGFCEPDLIVVDFENKKIYAVEVEKFHNKWHMKWRVKEKYKGSRDKYYDDIIWYIFDDKGIRRWI